MPNYIDRHVGAKLGEIRSRKGISPSELAKAVNLDAPRIEAYENAGLRLSAPVMFALCRALCVRPRDLFEGLGLSPREEAAMPVQLEEFLRERELDR